MKNYFLVLMSGIVFSSVGFAQTTSPTTKQPCVELVKLCQSAGYTINGPKGKDIWMDCVGLTLTGKQIVNANPQQIEACKADADSFPCTKIYNACGAAGYTGGPKKLPLFDCVIPLTKGVSVPNVTVSPDDLSTCKAVIDNQIAQQPCLRVMLACKDAGYSPDNQNGQVFTRNCFLPILNGQTVMGVSIDIATAKACQASTNATGTKTNQTP